jgi:DNA-binding GntR family transcriptional regulator
MASEHSVEPLVKHAVAERLREEIASGRLPPGVRIVEGTWARDFGVAQASIREAINLLAQEGFVTKAAGRSARVVKLSEQDVVGMYELRAVIEGLAARLTTQNQADVSMLEAALKKMRQALRKGRPENMLDGDLEFHLELCRLSGNAFVLEHARKILLPLFAFARIRVLSSGQEASVWGKDMEAHQRIVDLIRDGQPDITEQYVRYAMSRFARSAYDNWEKRPPSGAKSSGRAGRSSQPPKRARSTSKAGEPASRSEG